MSRTTITVLLLAAASNISTAAEIFAEPDTLCAALSAEGLDTDGWRHSQASSDGWACMSAPLEFGAAGPDGKQNSILFYVHGTTAGRAAEVLINVDINNTAERDAAYSRLQSSLSTLFEQIGEPVPTELTRALSKRESASVTAPFGLAELRLDAGPVESARVLLMPASGEDEDVEAIRVAEPDDFATCKYAVSKAAGFSPSRLVGDAERTEAAGQEGFMFMADGDLFFCEVHEDGRYRVKAAMDGDFHFRYIADDQF